MAWYAYCITEQAGLQGGSRARRPFALENLKGVNDAPVLGLSRAEISQSLSANTPPSKPLTQQSIVEHARVISECFRTVTVLPFRFGTIFESDEALRRAVRANRKAFLESVARLRGKSEMHVKIVVKDGTIEGSGRRSASRSRRGVSAQTSRPGQSRSGNARPRLGRSPCRCTSSSVLWKKMWSCKRMDSGNMLIDFAHLIDTNTVAKYQNRYSAATRHFKDCQVTISGPWPPYHFMPGKLRTVSGGN